MVYVTTYLLILTEQGPFFTPRNSSCYVHFIFPPPAHSLNPFLTKQGRAAPALHPCTTLLLAAGQTDLRTPAPRAMAQQVPPKPVLVHVPAAHGN